jgi:hypothetical protein
MTLPAAAEFMGNSHLAGENQLAFDMLELKACCVKRLINEWEDYILVPTGPDTAYARLPAPVK